MKKHKKITSIILALALILSCISSAFVTLAQENYKPAYNEMVTEDDVEALIGDVNTILNNEVLTGSAIESIYKMLPKLKSILMIDGSSSKSSDKGLFYKELQPERFANLPDGQLVEDTYDENGNLVTEGTFTAFFKENSIVCENASDFKKELDTIAKTVLVQNVMDTLQMIPMFSGDFNSASVLGTGIDEVCKALGIEQESSAATVFGFNAFVTGETYNIEAANKYIQNITAALFPDTANSVIDLLQNALKAENAKILYSGISKIINNLDKIVKGLASNLSGMGVNVDTVQEKIAEIKALFASLPTTGEGDETQLDIQNAAGYLISNLTSNAVGIKFGNGEAPDATVVLEFTDMKIDRFTNAETNADAVKIIYDYLYSNLIGNNKTNSLLKIGLSTGIIENAIGITLPEDAKAFIESALNMSNSELADELIVMVAGIAGREIPDDSENEKPAIPDDVDKPGTTDDFEKPGNDIKNPTKPGSDNQTNNNKTHKLVKKANIPNTGTVVLD